jgi:peptidyl-prolyl cis-trans isomerase C
MLCLAMLAPAGCERRVDSPAPNSPMDPHRTLAKIGAEDFTAAQFDAFLRERFPESSGPIPHNDQVLSALLDSAVNERLLLQAARQQGMSVSDKEVQEYLANSALMQNRNQEQWSEEDRRRRAERATEALLVNRYVQSIIAVTKPVSREAGKEYYDAHTEAFQEPDRYHVAEILVQDEPVAETVLHMLVRGRSFESLAQRYSKNELASRGGDLGWFAHGELPEQFEKAITGLKPGRHSQIVRTDYGYHIFKLKDVRKGHIVAFAQAQSQIQTLLVEEQEKEALAQEMARLRNATPIVIELPNLGFKYLHEKAGN